MKKLPYSKSISARALMIKAIMGTDCDLQHLSDCEDTLVMQAALRSTRKKNINVGNAGTAMRFLTAYYATRVGEEHLMTGDKRMRQRPIGPLVDALRSLGADITYEGEVGYPPLRIRGKRLKGGIVRIPGNISSQFISALLMIAPIVERGITLMMRGRVNSLPYIAMTLRMMHEFGAACQWTAPLQIDVLPRGYHRTEPFEVETDWTAASYWYSAVALSPDPDYSVTLPGLKAQSLQGDSYTAPLFAALGVATNFTEEGAVLTKQAVIEGGEFQQNLQNTPDLVPTLVVTCALLGRKFHFVGLNNLRYKECDRLEVLKSELAKLGITVEEPVTGSLTFDPEKQGAAPDLAKPVTIETHNDHRIAMAFAPASLKYKALTFDNPDVVAKSYPDFWTEWNA